MQQVKDQQFCISVFVAYLTIPSVSFSEKWNNQIAIFKDESKLYKSSWERVIIDRTS